MANLSDGETATVELYAVLSSATTLFNWGGSFKNFVNFYTRRGADAEFIEDYAVYLVGFDFGGGMADVWGGWDEKEDEICCDDGYAFSDGTNSDGLFGKQ